MSNTIYTNQLKLDASLNVSTTPAPIAVGDGATVAFSKIQSALFEKGSGTYKGSWNAATNTPPLSNATIEAAGNWYNVTTAGSVDFGAGAIVFTVSDAVYSTGSVYAKRDLPNTTLALADSNFLIGQADGLAAQKTITGDLTIDNTGKATFAFSGRTVAGIFDGTLKGGGVQYFSADQVITLAAMVIGTPYVMYNSGTATHTLTITGTGAVIIGGDALTSGLSQQVNQGTGYTLTKQTATIVYIS